MLRFLRRSLVAFILLAATSWSAAAQQMVSISGKITDPEGLALPGATILEFRDGGIAPVAFDDTEHVRITRSFLENPEQFLRHL